MQSLTSLLHDVRLIARLLTKSPAYALATALTLALAIGANSAIFSAVYGVLLKPLPIHDPSRLVVSWEIDQAHHLPVVEMTYRTIDDISRETRSFSHVARAWILEIVLLAGVGGALVSPRRTGSCARSSRSLRRRATTGGGVDRSSVAVFTAVTVIPTALLCGVGPVRQAVSTNLVESVNETGCATTSLHTRRMRSALVAAQIGLSVVLLVASPLVLRSFLNLQRLDLGVSPPGVLTMNVAPENATPSTSAWIEDLLVRIERLRHVEVAGAIDPSTYVSVALLVLVVVTRASYVPARRVARINQAKLLTRR